MGSVEGQWMDVFRAGDYGEKGSYTSADLDAAVRNYDPAQHEAPVVIGHPEHDAPAFGWVAAVRRVGNTLQAKLRQVAPQFEALLREGRFKKRSVAFYQTAKGLALRHLGFLGAMPPEVKGLADLQLCEFHDNGTFVAIEFQNSVQRAGGNMKANLAAGIALDPHSAKLNERTTALMAENSSVTFEEAAGQARTELGEGGRKFVIAVDPHSVKLLERVNVLRQRNSDLTFEEAASQARKEFGDKAPGV